MNKIKRQEVESNSGKRSRMIYEINGRTFVKTRQNPNRFEESFVEVFKIKSNCYSFFVGNN